MNMAAKTVSLRCGLGWHAPDSAPRWNDGYYFAKCRRCRCDLVRAAFGRWQAPYGYRVVWRSSRPEGVPVPELLRSTTATRSDRDASELPIQAARRDLQASNGASPQADAQVHTHSRSYVPDFMDDPATDATWPANRLTR